MATLLIIGAGQLGSRHLQGLAAVATPLDIHLLDPSAASLELARARFAEVAGHERHELTAHADASGLPGRFDLAISATTADHRLASIEAVLSVAAVRSMVLEKVLFQRRSDYDSAGALLAGGGVSTWVNCARRMFPVYREVREFFAGDPPSLVRVEGGAWGLGCNGIHFVDLFQFLTGEVPARFETTLLDPVVHPSKRPGFQEFSGRLVGLCGGRRLELESRVPGAQRHLITLRSDSRAVLIDETARVARFLDEGAGWTEHRFELPFQSMLTGSIAQDILGSGCCELPTFAESVAAHLPFLAALQGHHRAVTGSTSDLCPIT